MHILVNEQTCWNTDLIEHCSITTEDGKPVFENPTERQDVKVSITAHFMSGAKQTVNGSLHELYNTAFELMEEALVASIETDDEPCSNCFDCPWCDEDTDECTMPDPDKCRLTRKSPETYEHDECYHTNQHAIPDCDECPRRKDGECACPHDATCPIDVGNGASTENTEDWSKKGTYLVKE